MSRIFADHAPLYAAAGFAVIPTSGDAGKVPMVRGFNKWTTPPPPEKIRRWTDDPRFADANIGLLLSPSRLVVVDVDDPAHLEEAQSRFGTTPAWQWTPRGGTHLFFRARGDERATHLRGDGLNIDLKAGPGAYVLVEPSMRPDTGKAYDAGGSLIAALSEGVPFPEVGSWPSRGEARSRISANPVKGVRQGERNKYLFDRGLSFAVACDSLEDLEGELGALNAASCDPPVDVSEVANIAGSVWRYKTDGTLKRPGTGWDRGLVLKAETTALAGNSPAHHLLMVLRTHHALGQQFAVSPEAMVPLLQLSEKTIRKARDALLAAGILDCIHVGGRGPHDPSTYRFTKRWWG